MENELDLISRASQGDESAFAHLVRLHQDVLFNLAYRTVRDREDARDVTQVAFIKAYRNLDRFDRRHKFFSWLYRIMKNEALNLIARRRPHVSLCDEIPARDGLPDEGHERDRRREMVERAVSQLSPAHRDVIVLRHYLCLSYEEIGHRLGIPDRKVKARLHAARRRLDPMLRHSALLSEVSEAAWAAPLEESRR